MSHDKLENALIRAAILIVGALCLSVGLSWFEIDWTGSGPILKVTLGLLSVVFAAIGATLILNAIRIWRWFE